LSKTLPVSTIETLAFAPDRAHNDLRQLFCIPIPVTLANDLAMTPLIQKILCFAIGWSLIHGAFHTGLKAQGPQTSRNVIASNLIRPEYYTALDFIADGQTAQASSVLESALGQARMINGQRGIDSIPALVMMGECSLEQCDIAMALERYDAALQISMMGQRWLSYLKNPPGVTRVDSRIREIGWANNIRGTQMGSYTEAWPIALASPDVLVELQAGPGVTGKLVSIDALEVLRCQAIALRRRFQLLGPLAKHSPLNRDLVACFRVALNGQSEPIVCAMNICRALAEMGNGERAEPTRLLRQSLSLASGLDHPLTAVALLALADIAIESNEMLAAEECSNEAAFSSARAGQMEHLAESIEYLNLTGFANGHAAANAKLLPQIINWSSTKSRLVAIRGQVESTRLSALEGDVEGFKKHSTIGTSMLLPQAVVLPRAEAVLRHARAMVDLQDGKVGDGIIALLEGVGFLRGAESGVGAPSLFQLNLAQSLIGSKVLSEGVGESLLVELLNPPTAGHWRVHPLEQLAWQFADKSEAGKMLTDIQIRKRSDAEMVTAFDKAACRRYRAQGELESRVFDLQLAFHADKRLLNAFQANQVAGIRKQIPALEQNAAKIAEIITPLRGDPKWDLRKWSEEDTRRWESSLRLLDSQESQLWAKAIGPFAVPELFPPQHSQEELNKVILPSDAVLFFAFQGEQLRGYLCQAGKWKSWTVSNAESLRQNTLQFANDLTLLKSRDGTSDDLKKSWLVVKRLELRKQLFPAEVWAQLRTAQRWIVIPDRFLWYLPFETLPLSDQTTALPCISEHRIVYSPTLGLVPQLMETKSSISKSHCVDVHAVDFLTTNTARAKELREEFASSEKRVVIDLGSKGASYAPSSFFKIASDQVFSFVPSTLETVAPIPTDRIANKSSISSWRRLPWGTPASVVLPGVNALPPPSESHGDEWLRVALPVIAQGTKHLTISRWQVGGESTAALMRSFKDNRQDMTVSEAWQRSVVSLWEEKFDRKSEPVFQGAPSTDSEQTVAGSHPLLWSGYITIGDAK